MVAIRGRTFKKPWQRSCLSSKLKSSSAPIGREDSWCFHAVGSSNAPLLGSTAAEGLPRIGRTSIATHWRSCGLPQSASCSENFVIPPDVFGQTLRNGHLDRFDQLTGLKGLAQKGNAIGLERLLARGLVIEGGHEDDRKRGSGTLEPPPQFNTRHPAEMDVQEETIDLSYCSTIEEFLRRYEDHGRKALCVQQALGGIEHAGIVIHDCHDGPTL